MTQLVSITVLPAIDGKVNRENSVASAKICLKEDEVKGKFVVAQEEIGSGDVLVVEEPFSACLKPEYFGTHCNRCFDR